MTLLGVFVVLLLIALSAQLVGLFREVVSGGLRVETVLVTFGLKSITIIAFILPLSLYLAVLLALSRLYKDSEMTALSACGMSTLSMMRTVLSVAVLFAVMQGVLTLQLAPWAEAQTQRMFAKAQQSADIQGISPGRFNEMTEGVGVIYAQEMDQEQMRLRNVFLQQQRERGQSIVTSATGYQYSEPANGDRFIVLENGYRYEGEPGQDNYTIIEFKKHGIRIQEKAAEVISRKHKSIPTRELLLVDNLAYTSELQWRISSALMCIVLALLAVPLSKTSHRQGRYSKLALAIVLYMFFSNLLNVARNWLYTGKVDPLIGLWWVHVLIIVVAFIFIFRQTGIRHLFNRRLKA